MPDGPERVADGADERDVQFRVGIGKEPVRLARELPVLGRTTDWHGTLLRGDELLPLKAVEVLPDRHRRQAQAPRQRR